jgi:hypothetical protein
MTAVLSWAGIRDGVVRGSRGHTGKLECLAYHWLLRLHVRLAYNGASQR